MTSYSANEQQDLQESPASGSAGRRRESSNRPAAEQWKKALFIFNPVAGRSEIRTELVDILEISREDPMRSHVIRRNAAGTPEI